MFRHNPRHLLIRNAGKRRFEHRRQGNVLHRIVNDCQKIQHRLDFQRIKISRPRLCDRRNPLRRQHLDKFFFRPSANASKQNHTIPVLRPTVSAKLLIPDRDPVLYPSSHGSFRRSCALPALWRCNRLPHHLTRGIPSLSAAAPTNPPAKAPSLTHPGHPALQRLRPGCSATVSSRVGYFQLSVMIR